MTFLYFAPLITRWWLNIHTIVNVWLFYFPKSMFLVTERTSQGVTDLSWLLQETRQSTKKKIHLLIESETSNFRCTSCFSLERLWCPGWQLRTSLFKRQYRPSFFHFPLFVFYSNFAYNRELWPVTQAPSRFSSIVCPVSVIVSRSNQ